MTNGAVPTSEPDSTKTEGTAPERGRWAIAASVILWTVRMGLVGGLAFGLTQSIRLAWPIRWILDQRQWLDIVSFSGLAHAVFWSLNGAIVSVVIGLLILFGRGSRRVWGVVVLIFGLLVGLAATLLANRRLLLSIVALGQPPHRAWLLGMAGYLVAVAFVGRWIARRTETRRARWMRRLGRLAFWPAATISVICLGIQWTERPRLAEPTTRWKAAASRAAAGPQHRPNVVLIVLDTQRIDRLGCYGCARATTPRLDVFAADALVFENCISAGVWTLPSHASMFTGLHPSEHGANYDHKWLDDDFMTMAELLGRSGYETAAFSNNAWIGAGSNLAQGFDRVLCPTSLHNSRGNNLYQLIDGVLYPAGLVGTWLGALTSQDKGAKYTNQFIARWLERRDRSRPFFLFVNYLEPHSPYRPDLPHREAMIARQDIDASYRNGWRWDEVLGYALLKRESLTPKQLQLFNDAYNGETRVLDDRVGELLEILASHVPIDESLIIITSDHGENIGDHHLMTHYWCVYDTLAHVPLILRYPKRVVAGRTRELARTIDFLPTVMDAVHGGPIQTPSTSGRSLLPPSLCTTTASLKTPTSDPGYATNLAPPDRVAVTELISPGSFGIRTAKEHDPAFDDGPYQHPIRAIRCGPWKYIVSGEGREELYNLLKDPDEQSNLIETERPIADRLVERLREWLEASKPYALRPGASRRPELDEETRSRLRQLGYLR